MAITSLEQSIAQKERTWMSALLSSQTFWVIVAVLLAATYLSLATESFDTPRNLFNTTRNVTFFAIIAMGMTIVIITGGIDLSVGSVLCLCSMVIAVVMHGDIVFSFKWLEWAGMAGPYTVCAGGCNIYWGIGASVVTALLVGAFNGILVAYLGFPSFVVTLGMLSIARSLAMIVSNNTTISKFGPDHNLLLQLGGGATFGIANPVIYMVIMGLITAFVLRFTRFGRWVYAIGGNEHAATLTGVPVRGVKVAVYMISALTAGIAGIIQTGWLGAVTVSIGQGTELQVIAAAVIGGANLAGGVGTALGAIVGSSLIEVIRNSLGLLGINAYWQGTFIGGAIICAVLFERVRSLRSSN